MGSLQQFARDAQHVGVFRLMMWKELAPGAPPQTPMGELTAPPPPSPHTLLLIVLGSLVGTPPPKSCIRHWDCFKTVIQIGREVKCYNLMFILYDVPIASCTWWSAQGGEEPIKMADLQLGIVTPLKWHFATMCTLYVHVHRVFSWIYASGRVKATLHYCF